MEERIACKICILKKGLNNESPILKTEEELANHIEETHGIVVIGKGETKQQAIDRCAKKGIVKDKKVCKCDDCKRLRGD